jgi:hypothetical protein
MPTWRPFLALLGVLPTVLVLAVAAPADAARWVGRAYSASGDAPKIILRGRSLLGDDGAAYFAGRFRCIGACLARRGSATIAWWNDTDDFGHQAVEIALPDGSTCTSNAIFDSAFEELPPAVGTEVIVHYECEDPEGYDVLDSGTVDVTRVR